MNLLPSLHGAGWLLLAVSIANGQTGNKPFTFDAASVKIADKAFIPRVTGTMKGGPGTSDPGRITYTQVRLVELVMKAWEVEFYRVAGPEWLTHTGSELYNVTAVMPPETTRPQFQQMLQSLLIERFKIGLHHETRNYPGYELVVVPGGSRLRESDPDAPEPTAGPPTGADKQGFPILPPGHGKGVVMSNGVYAKFQSCTIAELVDPYLQSFIRQSTGAEINHIVDKTGLTGKYDYTLKFDARATDSAVHVAAGIQAASPQNTTSDPSGLPSLFSALEKQLGLKLVKSKGFPLDTIVIDHVDKMPTPN